MSTWLGAAGIWLDEEARPPDVVVRKGNDQDDCECYGKHRGCIWDGCQYMCKDGGFYSQRQHASWPSPPTPNTVLEKIVMMDMDTMVLASVHDRFDLSAPAAMKRGMCNDVRGLKHGDPRYVPANSWYHRGAFVNRNKGITC